jgi:hypothetical protein
MKDVVRRLKKILVRSIGVIMAFFIPGMAAGASTVGWFMGGVIGVATAFSSIIIFFGVQLAWDEVISDDDIEKGFRASVAKAAKENPEIAEAIQTSAEETLELEDVMGDLDELFDDKGNLK